MEVDTFFAEVWNCQMLMNLFAFLELSAIEAAVYFMDVAYRVVLLALSILSRLLLVHFRCLLQRI